MGMAYGWRGRQTAAVLFATVAENEKAQLLISSSLVYSMSRLRQSKVYMIAVMELIFILEKASISSQ